MPAFSYKNDLGRIVTIFVRGTGIVDDPGTPIKYVEPTCSFCAYTGSNLHSLDKTGKKVCTECYQAVLAQEFLQVVRQI